MLSILRHSFLNPLKEFIHDSKAIGIVLLFCTIVSLIIANSPLSLPYTNFWNFSFDGTNSHHTTIGFLHIPNSILLVINDFLMAFFFWLVGMEIKRELISGELSNIKNAILPVVAALGGIAAPALIFLLFTKGSQSINGWAIPTATDIAFAIGLAGLLGKKFPTPLKVFLTALAIIDDLGAIIIIALAYGGGIKIAYLAGAVACVALLVLLQKLKVKFNWLPFLIGFVLWYCTFNSGIHASIAGVAFAFCIPADKLARLQLKLHVPVFFIILPLFALANTALTINANSFTQLNSGLGWGIILGLSIGKPLGICLTTWFMVKKKFAVLPTYTRPITFLGASILAGIGFTMSIFIATLAFDNIEMQNLSKLSVIIASWVAMIVGYLVVRFGGSKLSKVK